MSDAIDIDRLAAIADIIEHGFAPNETTSNRVAKEMRAIVRRGTRVDFVVLTDDSAVDQKRGVIVVECDGHDFHERTKEQAARDRSRDRALTRSGIQFLRFTGREIYRSSYDCLIEIENTIWRQMFGTDCPLRQYDDEDNSCDGY